jgi:hypothetical protein
MKLTKLAVKRLEMQYFNTLSRYLDWETATYTARYMAKTKEAEIK